MASETGGRSDKLGNEFESLWAVRHLIELLSGRALSVRIEALGDDEKETGPNRVLIGASSVCPAQIFRLNG